MNKKKYNVYLNTTWDYNGNGVNSKSSKLIGTTYAVSERKAVSNLAFRMGIKTFDVRDIYGDGCVIRELEAIEA